MLDGLTQSHLELDDTKRLHLRIHNACILSYRNWEDAGPSLDDWRLGLEVLRDDLTFDELLKEDLSTANLDSCVIFAHIDVHLDRVLL